MKLTTRNRTGTHRVHLQKNAFSDFSIPQIEQVKIWLLAGHSYRETQEEIKSAFGVKIGTGAIHTFYHRSVAPDVWARENAVPEKTLTLELILRSEGRIISRQVVDAAAPKPTKPCGRRPGRVFKR